MKSPNSTRTRALVVGLAAGAALGLPGVGLAASYPGVAALQVALRARGLYPASIDGILGPRTIGAVRTFQRRKGLVVDGIPGPLTRAALGRYGRYRLGGRILSLGDSGWDVAELQFVLRSRGYRPGRLDGRFGSNTTDALLRLQARVGLTTDGAAGPQTLAALETARARRTGLTRAQARAAKAAGVLVIVRRLNHRLYFYEGSRPVRVFTVATGSSKTPTPLGRFRIVLKQRHPWWYPPDSPWARRRKPIPPGPGNPLGTRWMGISVSGVGIHGTPDAASVGYSISHGCVRMSVGDAEWLFRHVRVRTPVWVL